MYYYANRILKLSIVFYCIMQLCIFCKSCIDRPMQLLGNVENQHIGMSSASVPVVILKIRNDYHLFRYGITNLECENDVFLTNV